MSLSDEIIRILEEKSKQSHEAELDANELAEIEKKSTQLERELRAVKEKLEAYIEGRGTELPEFITERLGASQGKAKANAILEEMIKAHTAASGLMNAAKKKMPINAQHELGMAKRNLRNPLDEAAKILGIDSREISE